MTEITIYSDYVCPFCYLGRQSLAQYEAERDERVTIDWRPFDLRAQKRGQDGEIDHGVDDGKDGEYYEEARENVRRLRERYDVEMSLDVATDVDSLPAQVASLFVAETVPDRWREFDEGIFEALWVDGRDIGDPDVLADLATDAGVDAGDVCDAVEDDEWRERTFERFRAAHERGITAVPTFVYDDHAARGAVPPAHLRRLVEGA